MTTVFYFFKGNPLGTMYERTFDTRKEADKFSTHENVDLFEIVEKADTYQPILITRVNQDNLHILGRTGSWYVIATKTINGIEYYLLEHQQYGDETPWMIVDNKGKVIIDDACNGFNDLEYCLEEGLLDEEGVLTL